MSQGRTVLFVHNSITMALQQVIGMVSAFIIPRVLLSVYGSEINGFVVSVAQFISYFTLVEAGISGASVYALYKPLADRNIGTINSIISAAKRFYQTSGYIFLALVCLLAGLYPIFATTLELSAVQIILVVFALGIEGVLNFFTLSKYRVLLTASQKSYIISSAQILYTLLRILLIWGLAKIGCSIVMVEVAVVFAVFVRSWILYYYTRKHFPFVDYTADPDTESIKDRWNVLYLQLTVSALWGLPTILATIFTSLVEVSVFSVYNLVINGVRGILDIFSSGLAASFGDVIVRKQRKILKETTQQFEQTYYIVITVIYSAALLLILPFIKLYTINIEDANYILPTLAFLSVFNGLLYNLKSPQGMLVISAGMYRQTRWRSSIQALIAIIAGTFGAWHWGLYGIVGGVILSNIYRDIDLLFFIPKYVTKLSYKRSLRHMSLVLFTFFISSLIWFFYPLQITSAFEWIWKGSFVTFILLLWTLVTNYYLNPKNMRNIYQRVYMLVRHQFINRREKYAK